VFIGGEKMIIDITKLKQCILNELEVNEDIIIEKEMLEKAKIIDLKDANINGYITKDNDSDYYLDLSLRGTLVLPCSITLKPVDYDFATEIAGSYNEMMSEIEENSKINENSLDILPIIWQNILMEIPIKVTGPEATDLKLSGDGWKLVTEESEHTTKNAFDKLKDLL
jgi:uncharacterized protein